MALDKIVDSAQLDSDLTSVANAIRAKSGGSGQLAFPAGFVSEIGNIPSGGANHEADILSGSLSGTYVNDEVTSLRAQSLSGLTGLTSVSMPNVTGLNGNSFYNCSNVTSLYLPKLEKFTTNYNFSGMSKLPLVVLPKLTFGPGPFSFMNDTLLAVIDFGCGNESGRYSGTLAPNSFKATSLSTLIIRGTGGIMDLQNINAFDGTPFASNGSGGTLYVPQALISTYQSATNWSTILGYANNQIKSIESTHTDPNAPIDLTLYYADGTPIT